MAFADIAPTLAGVGITAGGVNNYFQNLPEPPTPPTPPNITQAKCVAVADKYFEDGKMNFENHGGYLGVARDVGLWVSQVKTIVKEIQACYAEWSESQE